MRVKQRLRIGKAITLATWLISYFKNKCNFQYHLQWSSRNVNKITESGLIWTSRRRVDKPLDQYSDGIYTHLWLIKRRYLQTREKDPLLNFLKNVTDAEDSMVMHIYINITNPRTYTKLRKINCSTQPYKKLLYTLSVVTKQSIKK
jgi:hypothetical protein